MCDATNGLAAQKVSDVPLMALIADAVRYDIKVRMATREHAVPLTAPFMQAQSAMPQMVCEAQPVCVTPRKALLLPMQRVTPPNEYVAWLEHVVQLAALLKRAHVTSPTSPQPQVSE